MRPVSARASPASGASAAAPIDSSAARRPGVVLRDRHDHAARRPFFPRGDLAPADRAEPREEGRLAAPRTEVAHGGDQRVLDDVFGGVLVPHAKDGEAEQPGEVVREELVERNFIAAEHAPDHFALAAVVHLDQLEGPQLLILRWGTSFPTI